ncbi:MAG: amidohydrolase family protein [Candidatus Lokiarchaeota archaeon]|nr:amidohydrolase family protein [Candidatus Lokiarchaeota archaeon]MBD3341851.1 amidohydrolase family protein [Candidatus Lokiarchaeota archaeon]
MMRKMEKILIKNGLVYDPLNNIEGEVIDIHAENGQIVEKFSNQNDVREIDAKGKTVVPGAIDIHAHIASQQVNWARLLGTKNEAFKKLWKGITLDDIARDYVSNGYTFIVEANIFPSLSNFAIFNFQQLPVLDKAMLLNVSNLWALEDEYQRKKTEDAAGFISDLLTKTKAFGLKVYNPFENEKWNFNVLREDLAEKGTLYNFSAVDVYKILAETNEMLKLPHSIHAHVEGYESQQGKTNLELILNEIKSLSLNNPSNTNGSRSQIFHLAHASAYNLDGENDTLIKFFNSNSEFDLDLGVLSFNEINPLITSDRRLFKHLSNQSPGEGNKKIIKSAVEFEGDYFVSLRSFSKKNKSHCVQWANSLLLALKITNKWQIQLSYNFPNYSHINNSADIAAILTSSRAREDFMKEMTDDFSNKNAIKGDLQNMTFNEYIIVSRASPAKSLGLGHIKGNFGVGADADINIIDIDAQNLDLEKNYSELKSALSDINYVLKGGNVVKQNDKIDLSAHGQIFWSKGKYSHKDFRSLLQKKKEFYQKYGSFFYDSLKSSVNQDLLREIT